MNRVMIQTRLLLDVFFTIHQDEFDSFNPLRAEQIMTFEKNINR